MKLINAALFALLTALFVGCGILIVSCHPLPNPNPPPSGDGGAASCATACAHARELKCKEGENTANGNTCEAVCENVQKSGIVVFNLQCRTLVKDCEALKACER